LRNGWLIQDFYSVIIAKEPLRFGKPVKIFSFVLIRQIEKRSVAGFLGRLLCERKVRVKKCGECGITANKAVWRLAFVIKHIFY